MKQRYQAIQQDAETWDEFMTWDEVLENIECRLDLDIFGSAQMERFARQLADWACRGELVLTVGVTS